MPSEFHLIHIYDTLVDDCQVRRALEGDEVWMQILRWMP